LTNQIGFSSCHIKGFEQNLKLAIIWLQKTPRDCRSDLFAGLGLDFSVKLQKPTFAGKASTIFSLSGMEVPTNPVQTHI
jgi:hypothetical protein